MENSIYHGIRQQTKPGRISISCVQNNDQIEICVTDNGPGFLKESADSILDTPSANYGLRNVNERIQLYFGRAYGLSIDTAYTEGARVFIRIPAVTASTETTIRLQEQGGTNDSHINH